jgi:hypothetical protein
MRKGLEINNELFSIKPEKEDILSNFLKRFKEIYNKGNQYVNTA